MQDIQNMPSPDIEPQDDTDEGKIPLPDDEPKPAPIEEPPNPDGGEIDEDNGEPIRIL